MEIKLHNRLGNWSNSTLLIELLVLVWTQFITNSWSLQLRILKSGTYVLLEMFYAQKYWIINYVFLSYGVVSFSRDIITIHWMVGLSQSTALVIGW